jgi:hypothetical protein
MQRTATLLLGLGLSISAIGCVADASNDDEETEATASDIKTSPGVNGGACALSPYNCKLRVQGGNRIDHTNGDEDWGVVSGTDVLDGNGDVLGPNNTSTLKFNYGQVRKFHGADFVYAMTTSNKSSGWFPLSAVKSGDVLSKRVGDVRAHRSGLGKMACYHVVDSMDDNLAAKKVVFDSSSGPGPAGEAAGDYLPRLRENGRRSVNLAFNTPGSGLGGPAIDHFPAGTKFQRLEVPTDTGRPSIDVPLWTQDGQGKFKSAAGTLKFVYGYVQSATGDVRVGWIAYPALAKSSGCP